MLYLAVCHMDFKSNILTELSVAMLNVRLPLSLEPITVHWLRFRTILVGTLWYWTSVCVLGLNRNEIESMVTTKGGRQRLHIAPFKLRGIVAASL